LEELQINSMYLEQVQSYKYLGPTVNSDNSIEEEIQHLEVKHIMLINFSLKVDWSPRNQIEIVLEYNKTNSNMCL
jgi:hypothetical protein